MCKIVKKFKEQNYMSSLLFSFVSCPTVTTVHPDLKLWTRSRLCHHEVMDLELPVSAVPGLAAWDLWLSWLDVLDQNNDLS